MNFNKNKKIRIKLEAFNSGLLNIACQCIIEKAKFAQIRVVGPIPLPIKKKIYCILRSPHVNKDSREHFEIRKYSRILDIFPMTGVSINSLFSISLPSGVKIILK